MASRKTIAGLCLLCALGLSAFAAQSASAAVAGTTAFTCKKLSGSEVGVGTPFTKVTRK